MKPHSKLLLSALLTTGATAAVAQSAWLPAEQQFKVTPGFSYSSFDEFWVGRTKVSPLKDNDESLDQYTGFITMEYGISKNFAADVTISYTATSDTRTLGSDSDEGLGDTSIGLRYRIVDEHDAPKEWMPSVAVRVGGIIAGTYDENTPFSAGDGANGLETSLLLGKSFGQSGFGLYGEIGYRWRESPVPDDYFASAGAFQQIGPVTVSAGYRHVESTSGLDIMGEGFDPSAGSASGFPALREINQMFEGGVSYTDNGGRNYQFVVAKSIDGRNTGDKLVFGLNVTIPFGGGE